jgi:Mg2+-importing ATPase
MNELDKTRFWQFDCADWFRILESNAGGLTTQKATFLLKKGNHSKKNVSRATKDFRLFISQYKNPLMLLLIGAVILSAFLGDTSDVFIILFMVISTGLLSFFQERNAGRVVEKLQSLIALKSLVLRDGNAVEIVSGLIVPGDVLLFKAGDIILADCLLLEVNELYVNESSLTGESFPVRKATGTIHENSSLAERYNCLWEGTNVVSGTATALVINTGIDTIFGSTIKSAETVHETAFEKGISDFGYFLMKITLVLSVFILIINLLSDKSVIESALFALALAVGMAPELLPAISTIAMSAGAKRLLNKKVIVKKLSSIQNLGEVNLLCTDKTGTITEGVISVHSIIDSEGSNSEFVHKLAYWNAILETGYANPIDIALTKMASPQEEIPVKISEIPYDFMRKRLSIAVKTEGENRLITKGAFSQILEICSLVRLSDGTVATLDAYRNQIENQFKSYGEQGFRVIAVCYKSVESGGEITKTDETAMIFAGFVLLSDPVKSGIIQVISELKKLKVSLKIITGDNINVATSIGKGIGISKPIVMTGKDLLTISPEALNQRVKTTQIFAELEPQQKERVIQALKHTYTVAYMGDGINDVAALNMADIGVSVDNAVDVAREAADFVLMEKDLSVLVEGIKEGRKTFSNTLKYIFINTGSTFGNMFSVAIASLLLPFLPMLPKQILLTNFITDFPYLSIASDNVDEEQLSKPGKWNLRFIRLYMVIFGIHSSLFDVITFLVLYFGLRVKEAAFQTGWFIESILTELFILFIIRTHKNFFKSKPGKYLLVLSILGLVITIGLPYTPLASEIGIQPLPVYYIGILFLIVFFYILTADLLKVWFFRKYRRDA